MEAAAFEDLLARYPPDVQALAARTRELILESLPAVEETVDTSARLIAYGYGPGYKGMVCTLIPSQKGVKLGIYCGSELPDPRACSKAAARSTVMSRSRLPPTCAGPASSSSCATHGTARDRRHG